MSEIVSGDEGGTEDSVWSKDVEDAFEEALAIYPPCGRRKIILSDEGKMYGRNELIARYVKMRTGKTRTRKQVSSHIQVLARKKQRELSLKLKHCDETIRKTALENLATMSSAQIVSATMGLQNNSSGGEGPPSPHMGGRGMPKEEYWDGPPRGGPDYGYGGGMYGGGYGGRGDMYGPPMYGGVPPLPYAKPYGPPVSYPPLPRSGPRMPPGHRLCMQDFHAFVEYRWPNSDQFMKHSFVHLTGTELFRDPEMEMVDIRQIYDKFPGLRELYAQGPKECFYLIKFWVDLNYATNTAERDYYMAARYDSPDYMSIQSSSRVCSFGKQVVEKIQEPTTPNIDPSNGLYVYRFTRTAICEYMVSFVEKLRGLESTDMMNSVLENFSVLQVVTEMTTGAVLFCVAFVFEVSSSEHGAQHHIYRLIDE
eukprot:comp24045_c0_seq2/m.43128 comp24045_c0_seq2/g.43128  ORF comp24045_c0_seq2/g.43128 comp24045_c0_seq2/m.43128 type:complete len:423 (-) comp24045_c0_seq2:436-1704(-)